MFNLEKAIKEWKRQLRTNPSFEDGDIIELESHLRDEIKRLKNAGYSDEEAFSEAVNEIGKPDSIGDEMFKTRATGIHATPSWKQQSWIPSLLPNYVKVAVRNIKRRTGYTVINVMGLAVGIATCLLILFYIKDELAYDRFHESDDRIYRIVSDWGDFSVPATSMPVVNRLKDDFPQIEQLSWVMETDALVRYENNSFVENNIYISPPTFLSMFNFPLKRGNPETVLTRPFTVVLTQASAKKYFGNQNPVGRSLEVDNQYEVEVTGVLEKIPGNTHFDFDFLISWQTMEAAFNFSEAMEGQWGSNSIYTYLKLKEKALPETVERSFPAFIERHAGDNWNNSTLSLQPLTSIHLYSHHNSELSPNSQAAYIYIFAVIAAGILFIACINFVNLATARSAERAREVGVRKSLGANRIQLIRQFLSESVLLALFSMIISLILVSAAMPAFRLLSGKSVLLGEMLDGITVLILVGITVVIGLLAGGVPAFALSRFQPVSVLRGVLPATTGGEWLRKGLVVFQFAISIILIIGTVIVYNQLEFLRSANLGFDKEQVVIVPMRGGDEVHLPRLDAFRQNLLQHEDVEQVTAASTGLPSELLDGSGVAFAESNVSEDSLMDLRMVSVSHDFFEAMGVELIAGRSYSRDFPTDSSAYMLNEAGYRLLANSLPQSVSDPGEVIGKQIRGWHDFPPTGELIGITENFNMATLHEQVEPILFLIRPSWYDNYLVRIRPGAIERTLETVKSSWEQFFPGWPFDYRFADEAFDARYRAEERLGQIFAVFSGLAIFVACLGLFGLAAFTAEKRTKEIGVRKVLGATVSQIVLLLTRDFMKVVGIAFLVAIPVSWYAMQRWLQDFAYHIEIEVWIYAAAGLLVLLITVITVSGQSIKAAMMNPVNSLKSE